MNYLSDLDAALRSDLNIPINSSQFPASTRYSALNRSYIKCGKLFKWPPLQDALLTTTQKNIDYYDAPDIWTPMCIWRLEVDDEQYGEVPDGSPMDFNDFQEWKADHVGSDEKKWSIFWPYYFIYPTPTVADKVISVWGQKNVVEMVQEEDTTIFSFSMPEGNEAIVLEASQILQRKGENIKTGEMLSIEAKQILIVAFNKIRQEMGKIEKVQPLLNVPDFFGRGNSKKTIGKFDYDF